MGRSSREMGKEKTHINVVVIGHVDSGKSTTTGHLSTSVVASTSVSSRSSRRRPPSSARAPSSTHGCLTSSRPSVSAVSPLTSPSGSSSHPSTTSPSLMPQDIVISSRTLPAPPRLILPCSSSPRRLVSSRLVSPRMARPVTRTPRLHSRSEADARCHEQDGQHHPTLLRGSLQGDQGGGHQLLEEDWLRPKQDPIHPYLRLPRRQHDRGLHQHGLVQGPMSARLPRHRQASKEASGQATPPSSPGCLQDRWHWNSPSRPRRDWRYQARSDRHLRPIRRDHRVQIRRDAPRVHATGCPW